MLICPICMKALQKNEKTYRCSENHCFDLAASGYVNLLLPKNHAGDNQEMVTARRNFLAKGYFQQLVTNLIDLLKMVADKKVVLDCGCGEGYFLDKCQAAFPDSLFYGLDISKHAIDKAAKRNKDICFIVANSANIPFADQSADVIINIFAPHFPEEFARVLKTDGYVLKVIPGPRHLLELKEALYEKVYLNDTDVYLPGFCLQETRTLTYQANIGEDLHNLLQMTPYFYRTPQSGLDKIASLKELEITFDFIISLYKK